MAPGESQDRSWAAKGYAAMSFFVCFLYASKAVLNLVVNIVSKSVEEVEIGETWDIVLVGRAWLDAWGITRKSYSSNWGKRIHPST
jgi:hypothetical protein